MTHYCKVHDEVFFKKGKMKNYAHPIKDESGEDTGEWCNEPEETKPKSESSQGYRGKSPEERASIEIQNAYSGVVSLMGCGMLGIETPLAQAALSYAASKLSNWYSQGEPEEVKPSADTPPEEKKSDEPKATEAQLKKIWATAKEKGYTPENATAIMVRQFKVASSKALSKKQASEFIDILSAGKFLNEELEVEDLPF